MAHGKHIGKVLVQIRPDEHDVTTNIYAQCNGDARETACPSKHALKAIRRTLCHPEHVYIVTGGLGGFGLELAKWLVTRGARK